MSMEGMSAWADSLNADPQNGSSNITFADAAVKAICVENWDDDGDGEISYSEAANVTTIGEVFRQKNNINSFNELQYFTGINHIPGYAFYYSSLTSITLPNSVKSIDNRAFYGCHGLTSIVLPDGLQSIRHYAFSYCGVGTITIPTSCTYLDVGALGSVIKVYANWVSPPTLPEKGLGRNAIVLVPSGTKDAYVEAGWMVAGGGIVELGSPVIPFANDEVKSACVGKWDYDGDGEISYSEAAVVRQIDNGVFNIITNTFSFDELQFFSSLTSIGGSAFQGCTGLTSVTIPNSVTSIGSNVFQGCSSLTSVTIPNSVTSIGSNVFQCCSSLTSVTIGNSVTSIGNNVFECCSSLTSLTIPNSVTSIGDNAFNGCTGLTSLTIPNSVTSIGQVAFANCTGLTSLTIPNSVTSIGDYAFNGCTGLTSLTIPNSVTSIGQGAFGGCTGLASITIGNSVTSLSTVLFSGCSSLTSIDIPNSVTSIGLGAFWGCSSLTSIDIPNSVTGIGGSAFQGCTGLTSLTIPNSVTSIGDYAFIGCSSLTSVNIPNSVTSIGSNVFYGCSSLTSVNIPNSVTSIGDNAFWGCSSLTSIDIPNSVTSIGKSAFSECSGLTSITIGNSVTSIGNSAFEDCSSLAKVSINNLEAWCNILFGANYSNPLSYAHHLYLGQSEITELEIPSSVTSIGDYAFQDCSGLTSVTIGNSVTSIGKSAFQNCSGLRSIDISNSVTSIGLSAFEGCSSLTSIYIPNTVTSIVNRAFANCTGLTSVIVMWESPINIIAWSDDKVFYGVNCGQVTLYVPYGCKDAYLDAGVWNQFNIEELTSQQIINATGISLNCSSLTFDGTGQTATLAATITPVDATFKTVVWSSNNTDVATVDDNGVVTAIGNGTAVITAKTIDGTSLTAQCNVTVNLQTVTITMATNSGSAREAIGYSFGCGLDFTNVTDVKAYVATGFTDDGDVLLSRIYIVPANTGVYLKSVAGAGITVTVPTTAKYVLYANLLKPYIGTGTLAASKTIDGVTYKNYVVGTKDGKPSFAIWGGGTFGPHKAYMPIPESLVPTAARAGGFSVKYIDEEPTAIEETIGYSTPASDILYDLQGRKVSNAKRGIYVRNGKKIFIK